MGFDGEAVVRSGRVVLEGLPYEDGRTVKVQVTPTDEPPVDLRSPGELSPEEWVARMRRIAKELHAIQPDAPVLSDYALSRESVYED